MFQQQIERLLAKRIGLSAQIVGSKMIAQAIQTRMAQCGLTNEQTYWQLLQSTATEWENLLATVVIPETWFFRNQSTFNFINQYIKLNWLSQSKHLRVLSIPCSTGEEPYSIAITLLEAGLSIHQFQIDAVDISQSALEQAQQGFYPPTAFRGQINRSWQQRYFALTPTGYQIRADVQSAVRFIKGNLLDPQLLRVAEPYDILFCRNLLIYWEEPARKIGIKQLKRLLSHRGILLVGHAEINYFYQQGFEKNDSIGAFSCRTPFQNNLPSVNSVVKSIDLTHQPISQLVNTLSKPLQLVKPVLSIVKPTQSPHSVNNAEFNRAVKDTKPEEDWLSIAQQAADRGQLKQAFNLCKKCLAKQWDNVPAYFLMGIICQALGWNSQAETYFNKTVYLEPNHMDALNHLASLVEYRGDKEQAAHLRRRVQRIRQRG
ncbi:MAG: chemotaxis protein [Thioploca sp.]|nr:chemotaxis protein [Thioploca sp.]